MKPKTPSTLGQTKQAIAVHGKRNMFTVTSTYEREEHCFQTCIVFRLIHLHHSLVIIEF